MSSIGEELTPPDGLPVFMWHERFKVANPHLYRTGLECPLKSIPADCGRWIQTHDRDPAVGLGPSKYRTPDLLEILQSADLVAVCVHNPGSEWSYRAREADASDFLLFHYKSMQRCATTLHIHTLAAAKDEWLDFVADHIKVDAILWVLDRASFAVRPIGRPQVRRQAVSE